MKRRNLLLTALATIAAPVASVKAVAKAAAMPHCDRLPIMALRSQTGCTECYALPEDAHEGDEVATNSVWHPAELVPTGEFLVFDIETKLAKEYTDPATVPQEVWKHGYGFSIRHHEPSEHLTRSEAIARAIKFNRETMWTKGDRWAVVVQVGETQGPRGECLEMSEGIVTLTRSDYAPGRIIALSGGES